MTSNSLFSRRWWAETESPRWALAVGAVAVAVLTAGATFLVDVRVSTVERRAAQVQSLRDAMVDFQVFASAFSTEMFAEGKVSTATKSRLIENLNQQHALIRGLDGAVVEASKDDLESYRKSVLAMTDVINRTSDLMSMKDFWSAASTLTVARNRLDSKLRNFS